MGDFTGAFAALFIRAVPFDNKRLSDMREVQIVVKSGGDPYFSDFYTSMIWWSDTDVIRLLPVMEVQLDIFKECGLIPFDGEMIMRPSIY